MLYIIIIWYRVNVEPCGALPETDIGVKHLSFVDYHSAIALSNDIRSPCHGVIQPSSCVCHRAPLICPEHCSRAMLASHRPEQWGHWSPQVVGRWGNAHWWCDLPFVQHQPLSTHFTKLYHGLFRVTCGCRSFVYSFHKMNAFIQPSAIFQAYLMGNDLLHRDVAYA